MFILPQGACMKQPYFFSLVAAILAFSSLTSFAESNTIAANSPDATQGEALYTNGDASRQIVACVSCHGAAGNATIVQNPKLAGQHAPYLLKQLNDFTGPTRANPVMSTMAKALTTQDKKNLSAYLSQQQPKPGAAKDKTLLDLGKQIYRAGIASIHVPACAACHGPTGSGIPGSAAYPRLAGQHQEYTVAQLLAFRSGTRSNGPKMVTISHRMTDDEMKAVADYIAGLK